MTAESDMIQYVLKCFLCERSEVKDSEWTLESLKFIYAFDRRDDFNCLKLCPKHLEFCEKRIKELEDLEAKKPKESDGKKQEPFLPKPLKSGQVKERNFYDREPGSDDT